MRKLSDLSGEEQEHQIAFRDARVNGAYNDIWKSVGRCVFCEHDGHIVFYEENNVYMFVPSYAYIDGHILIAPQQHITSLKELTPGQWETMRKMFYIAKKMIREVHGIKGMQIIQKDGRDAQSTVEHLHVHCMPFDTPDFSTWNYRHLENTPFENAELYRDKLTKIKKLSKRFGEKYGG